MILCILELSFVSYLFLILFYFVLFCSRSLRHEVNTPVGLSKFQICISFSITFSQVNVPAMNGSLNGKNDVRCILYEVKEKGDISAALLTLSVDQSCHSSFRFSLVNGLSSKHKIIPPFFTALLVCDFKFIYEYNLCVCILCLYAYNEQPTTVQRSWLIFAKSFKFVNFSLLNVAHNM